MDHKDTTNERIVLITWSPKTNTTLKNVNKLIDKHCNLFFYKLILFANNFELNPELNMNGNIHYHGYIAFNNEEKKYYNQFILTLKANGLTKITTVKHSLCQAMEYCRKDRSANIGLIHIKYLPIADDNINRWCMYHIYNNSLTTAQPITLFDVKKVLKNKKIQSERDEIEDEGLEKGLDKEA